MAEYRDDVVGIQPLIHTKSTYEINLHLRDGTVARLSLKRDFSGYRLIDRARRLTDDEVALIVEHAKGHK
jgi:hypothetical protein